MFDIARFEFRRMFLSPLAWIVLALIQFVLAMLFYMLLSQYLQEPALYAGRGLTEVVVGGFYQSAGFILLLITPFITMRLLSEELRTGTIKLLLSSPLAITGLVLGKYLGCLLFMLCLLLLISLMPAGLMLGTRLDYGQFAAAILGLALLMCSFSAIGLFISSLFRHPAMAAIATFALALMLWTSHVAGMGNDTAVASVFNYLSMLVHYSPFTLGIFNAVDFIYFLLLTVTFILLSIWRIDALRTHHW
ncbi:MAG: ABC transporter permease subunit [Gammaproteobacteria bacterium]